MTLSKRWWNERNSIRFWIYNILVFMGSLLVFTDFFLPSRVIIIGESFQFESQSFFYPLGIGIILCLITSRYFGIFACGSFTLFLFIMGPFNTYFFEKDNFISRTMEVGLYLVFFGCILTIIGGLLCLKDFKNYDKNRIKKERIIAFIVTLLLFFLNWILLDLTITLYDLPDNFIQNIFESLLIVTASIIIIGVILIVSISLTQKIKKTFFSDNSHLINISISLTIWGLVAIVVAKNFIIVAPAPGNETYFYIGSLIFGLVSFSTGIIIISNCLIIKFLIKHNLITYFTN